MIFKRGLKEKMTFIKKYIFLVLIHFFNLLPIKNNKIFFFSYYGSGYGCNPKYITEYILERYPKDQYDVVWAFNDLKSKTHLNFRKVRTMSLKYFYELCTSKVVITNFRTTDLFVKRKGQYYIQTWHSSLRLKQIEKDAEADLPESYVEMAKKDSLKCDLLLSGCQYSTDIFKKAFWYEGPIFEAGTPRNDMLFRQEPEKREKILKSLGLKSDVNIILYAPTFRKNNDMSVYQFDDRKLLEAVKKRFGGKWIVLVKLHPHLLSKANQLTFGPNVLDVTTYDDIQELLSITDLLISDYSSLIFDFAITQRPCFLYVPDVDEYIRNDRDLYFNLFELPFISAFSNQDLLDKIMEFNLGDYQRHLSGFLEKVGSYEKGSASEQLLGHIDEVCFGIIPRRARHEAV